MSRDETPTVPTAAPVVPVDAWAQWVGLRDRLDDLQRDRAEGYAGAKRWRSGIAEARQAVDAFVEGLIARVAGAAQPDATGMSEGDAATCVDDVDPDRLGVMPCTVPLPTPDMMRTRLARDGWAEEASSVDGVALHTLTPPGYETEFELVMPDEAVPGNGWRSHVEQALRTLVGLEDRADGEARNRPIGDLAAEIIAEARQGPRSPTPPRNRGRVGNSPAGLPPRK